MKEASRIQKDNGTGYGPQKRRAYPLAALILIALCILYTPTQFFDNALSIGFTKPQYKVEGNEMNQWSDIKPSKSLQFSKCFNGFDCARLDVPLDWTAKDKAGGKRGAVAILRVPAKVPVTDPRYGGAVLINPGGPGGSGIFFALGAGTALQTIIDARDSPKVTASLSNSGAKYFDIIGFDPRGVNNTTPHARCFPNDESLASWAQQARAQGHARSNESFANSWARSVSIGQSCSWRMSLEDDTDEDDPMAVGKYVSTPNTVEDMVAIIEALGEWRAAEAKRLIDSNAAWQKGSCKKQQSEIMERVKWIKGKEKLQYWGFSYGTLLGTTFATIHPDRVGRLAVDGQVNADDYYSGTWLENLYDAEAILDSILTQCHAAGAFGCSLYDSSPEKIKAKYHRIMEEVKREPIAVPARSGFGPQIITYVDVLPIIIQTLYSPARATMMASIMWQLGNKKAGFLAEMKDSGTPVSCSNPLCRENPWTKTCYGPSFHGLVGTASAAILCTDARDIRHMTSQDHFLKYQKLIGQSPTLGGTWSQITMPCSSWDIRPAWNFTKPIGANNTSHPLLFLSMMRDPVTPLRNARLMSSKFPGSVVFGQNGDGHCTIAQPSLCVANGIREYFQTENMPKGDMGCKPDKGVFGQPIPGSVVATEADFETTEGLKILAEHSRERMFPLGIV